MVRLVQERVLLVGDAGRELQGVLLQALPGVGVTAVPTLFDAIAELSSNQFTTVLAAAEPLERRPEAAVRALRELAGDARLLLFGHPTLEILSQKMLQFGCDDYLITPANAAEFLQIFASPPLRLADDNAPSNPDSPSPTPPVTLSPLTRTPLAELLLDALLAHPHDALNAAANQINAHVAPELELRLTRPGEAPPAAPEGQVHVSNPVRNGAEEVGTLHLMLTPSEPHDETVARHALAQVGQLMGKVAALQDRHNKMQKLAITDELTGSANSRYFRHFLASIIERARQLHFPVTLLLFDIDDFKKYNDQFGHATGDEILRQAAALMKR
ncbi:MAG TPA: GGDEF domain-containing protein, partial [Tepidisphaeraceae bacterium]